MSVSSTDPAADLSDQAVAPASDQPDSQFYHYNVGGKEFAFTKTSIAKLAEENLLRMTVQEHESVTSLKKRKFVAIDANPAVFKKWFDPYIRFGLLPDIGSIKNQQEKNTIIATADMLIMPAFVEHLTKIPKAEGAFGAEEWAEYFGLNVTDVPALPDNVKYDPEKEVMFLMPKGLSLNRLGELIQNPNKGNKTEFHYVWGRITSEHGSKVVESSYWAVMSRDIIAGSRKKPREEQLSLAESKGGCAPTLLEAATACFTEYVVTGNRLLTDDPWTLTTCQEIVSLCKLIVGGFSASGLFVDGFVGAGNDGVVVLRKL